MIINPESETLEFNFRVFNNSINFTENNLTKTFTLDSDSPNLESITTDYEASNKTYMRSGGTKLYFGFDDTSENFNRMQVFYSIGGSATAKPMNECTAGNCWSYFTKTCSSGQSEIIKLKTGISQDDAGNPITSSIEKRICCDRFKG